MRRDRGLTRRVAVELMERALLGAQNDEHVSDLRAIHRGPPPEKSMTLEQMVTACHLHLVGGKVST